MPDRRRWACSERLSCKSTQMRYPESRQLFTCLLFEAPLACLAEDDKDAFHVKVGAPGLLRSASPGCWMIHTAVIVSSVHPCVCGALERMFMQRHKHVLCVTNGCKFVKSGMIPWLCFSAHHLWKRFLSPWATAHPCWVYGLSQRASRCRTRLTTRDKWTGCGVGGWVWMFCLAASTLNTLCHFRCCVNRVPLLLLPPFSVWRAHPKHELPGWSSAINSLRLTGLVLWVSHGQSFLPDL